MHIYSLTVVCFFICVVSCGLKEGNPLTEVVPHNSISETNSNSQSTLYEGLYLNNWNNSGVIIIFKGKIHHFNRQQFESIYKDEEYDYSGLEDGHLLINRTYRMDRKKDIVSKSTILKDIRPIIEDVTTAALERNGRIFERMNNYGSFLDKFSWNLEDTKQKYASEWKVDLIDLHQALTTTQYYKIPFLTNCILRDGEIRFDEILRQILLSKL